VNASPDPATASTPRSITADEVEHHDVTTNGIRLHVVQAGPAEGPLVLLLHGFPEFWYGWRYQIPALVEQGYRVWAPDLRGYNRSDKPEGVRAYQLQTLTEDVAGLIDAAGRVPAAVIGHDWGGILAWHLATIAPERVRRLVILNVPHPVVMFDHLRRNPRQMLRSSYIALFQLPRIPEFIGRRMLARALQKSSRPGTFTSADLKLYREAWSQPGALTAMLNWYRALWFSMRSVRDRPRIRVPTLLLWGTQDVALGKELAQPSIDLCEYGWLEFFETATHWLQHEEPEQVNARIQAFIHDGAGPAAVS